MSIFGICFILSSQTVYFFSKLFFDVIFTPSDSSFVYFEAYESSKVTIISNKVKNYSSKSR